MTITMGFHHQELITNSSQDSCYEGAGCNTIPHLPHFPSRLFFKNTLLIQLLSMSCALFCKWQYGMEGQVSGSSEQQKQCF